MDIWNRGIIGLLYLLIYFLAFLCTLQIKYSHWNVLSFYISDIFHVIYIMYLYIFHINIHADILCKYGTTNIICKQSINNAKLVHALLDFILFPLSFVNHFVVYHITGISLMRVIITLYSLQILEKLFQKLLIIARFGCRR